MNNKKNKKFKFYKKDYNQLPKKFFQKFEIIIDLVNISNDPASELNKKFTYQTNYKNKIKLYSKIKNLKNISKYIYMSSCSVYGNNKNIINEKSKPEPTNVELYKCSSVEETCISLSINKDFPNCSKSKISMC